MSVGIARKRRGAAIDAPSSLGADAFNDNFGRSVMTDFGAERIRDEVVLIARILLALLFLTFGWGKFTSFSGTVAYMSQSGVPLPTIAALVAIVVELLCPSQSLSVSGHGPWRCCWRSTPLPLH
jgi:hypothetical protein